MATVAWLLNNVPLADLGISESSAQFINQGISRMVFAIRNATLAEAVGFTYRQDVTIKRDGVIWFVGKIAKTPRWGEWGKAGSTIEVWDAWWDLSLLTYEQAWNGGVTTRILQNADKITEATDENGGVQIGVGDWIRYEYEGGDPQDTKDELQNLLSFAKQRGVALQIGTLLTGYEVWPEEFVDRKVAELIIALLRWHPFAVTWFDYGTEGGPTLHVQTRGDTSVLVRLPDLSFNLSAGGQITVSHCDPRSDLVPPCILIRYELQEDGEATIVHTDKAPAGATGKEIGAFITTVTLGDGAAWDTTPIVGAPPPPDGWTLTRIPEDFAQRYYDEYTLTHDGEMEIAEENAGSTRYMGKCVNFSNGLAAWTTMRAPVQSVTVDLRFARTNIVFGSGNAIGIEDALKRLLRYRRPTNQGKRDTSTPPEDEFAPAAGPLCAFCVRIDEDTVAMRVAPGIVADGIEETVPTFGDSGIALDAVVPPEIEVTEGALFELYLEVDWTPNVSAFTLLDDLGATFTEYRAVGTGTVNSTRIAFTVSGAQPSIVNAATGEVTQDAVLFFHLGTFRWDVGQSPSYQPKRIGSVQVIHMPPERYYLMFASASV